MRHFRLWGRYWKSTSEHQVLCMGDLALSLHLLGMSAWVQSMKSQQADFHRLGVTHGKEVGYGPVL